MLHTRFLRSVYRSSWAKTALLLAIVVMPAVYVYSKIGYTETGLERTLWDLGFYPVKPPSNLIAPGSIYHVNSRRKILRNNLRGGCQRRSFGA